MGMVSITVKKVPVVKMVQIKIYLRDIMAHTTFDWNQRKSQTQIKSMFFRIAKAIIGYESESDNYSAIHHAAKKFRSRVSNYKKSLEKFKKSNNDWIDAFV